MLYLVSLSSAIGARYSAIDNAFSTLLHSSLFYFSLLYSPLFFFSIPLFSILLYFIYSLIRHPLLHHPAYEGSRLFQISFATLHLTPYS